MITKSASANAIPISQRTSMGHNLNSNADNPVTAFTRCVTFSNDLAV
jgi:hypothetical protein